MLEDIFSLKGRVALITGGSRGIGKMIAKGFIEAGAKVYISSRKAEACEKTAQELGPNCIPVPADVSRMEGIEELKARVCALEPKLDILVNNAGLAWMNPFEEFTETGWDRVVDLNMKSPFFLIQKFYPALKAAAAEGHCAKVINITSIDGIAPNPVETYSYHASKAGLIYLTRRLAARLAPEQIIVNGIAPGAFATDMNVLARDNPEISAGKAPIGRIGTEADIAAAAVYLASRAGDFVVGSTLAVDGGVAYGGFGRNH